MPSTTLFPLETPRAYSSHFITAERVHAEGMDAVLATIPEGRAVYVTIDADGLDPAEMPGVMAAPTPGGLRFRISEQSLIQGKNFMLWWET